MIHDSPFVQAAVGKDGEAYLMNRLGDIWRVMMGPDGPIIQLISVSMRKDGWPEALKGQFATPCRCGDPNCKGDAAA